MIYKGLCGVKMDYQPHSYFWYTPQPATSHVMNTPCSRSLLVRLILLQHPHLVHVSVSVSRKRLVGLLKEDLLNHYKLSQAQSNGQPILQ